MITVRPAHADDWSTIERLLIENVRPLQGARGHLGSFIVAHVAGVLLGCVGLEARSKVGLLRSVAVASRARGTGVGAALSRAILGQARQRGLTHVYLLTNRAASYFARYGFVQAGCEGAPSERLASEEFRGACPASATLMVIASS